MQKVLLSQGAAAPPAGTRAAGQAARPGTGHPPQTPGQRWRAFALLVVAYFITIVDFTIVNVALPAIGRELDFPESDLQWVVTAYGLTFAGFLLLGGRAADLLGRRRLLMAGLVVFTCASLGGGLATSDTFLIVMRGIQGLGAALVLPAALSIVMNMFSEGAERNKALGIWGGVGALGGTVGLLAGGILTTYAGWQYIFFFNVPIGAAALALVPKVVPESSTQQRTAALRPLRRRLDHRRPAGLRLCHLRGPSGRVGGPANRFDAGRGSCAPRRVLRHRNQGRSAPAAAAAVSPAQRGRIERCRLPARSEFLHLRLPGHPVHAAGARLLRSGDRGGLDDGVGHIPGLLRPVPANRDEDLSQDRHGLRHGAHRGRNPVGSPGAHPSGASGRTWPGRSSWPASAPRSRSSRSPSAPSPG